VAIFSIFYPLRFFIRFFVSLLILPFLYRLPFPPGAEIRAKKKAALRRWDVVAHAFRLNCVAYFW
jgi:hypothetical protein